MEWLLTSVIFFALVIVLIYRHKLQSVLVINSNIERRAAYGRVADNALLLSVLSREIANEMMQRDSSKYKTNFNLLLQKWADICDQNPAQKSKHLNEITSIYRSFRDFDELQTTPHVLYAEGFSGRTDEELWELYEGIRLYDALNCDLDEEWKLSGSSITQNEMDDLAEYCIQLDDTKLLAHLHRAREQLHLLEDFKAQEKEGDWLYETCNYKFRRVYHVAENRWGVYVKSMDRYGMWGYFAEEVSYTSFYASDEDFNERWIDSLDIRICLEKEPYSTIEKHSD